MFKLLFRIITLPFAIIFLVPVLIYQTFKISMDSKDFEESTKRAPAFFRGLKNEIGSPVIPGIEELSDWIIELRYRQVREGLEEIAERRKEKLSRALINGVVRDVLLDEIYNKEFSDEARALKLKEYEAHGAQSLMVKGRLYV